MISMITKSLKRGTATTKYPIKQEAAPQNFRGKPVVDPGKCDACRKCAEICPTMSINAENRSIAVCIGSCLFCGACIDACPKGAIAHSQEFEISSAGRERLYDKYEAGAK